MKIGTILYSYDDYNYEINIENIDWACDRIILWKEFSKQQYGVTWV